ncbi:TRAP transporter substrate-binding protein [Allosediminivita pacifica]|uniref:Tripartite ATP-independent transporter DctP family solute receptor n=1 Tax=Allosediminivita pacifica TaxID=1267769 RepID=A0A2T6ATR4_9RHOB|nr:TRAP transporter substrate-binding protein [Allosediminivita pacifica]PTX47205.1 tripartite ATP-independent transporter DctP family solute receptor [Allosediminivita pacifica]GGB09435.1 C4-dicarboxylate ABC transporter substrate-binding protein [Allosediminivita pacifica]
MTVIPRTIKFTLLASVLGFGALSAQADELRIGSNFGDTHSTAQALRGVFAEKVEELTEGRHTVAVFANAELGQTNEMINQAQSGINFGAYASTAFFNAQVPELGVTNLPFVFPNREVAFEVIDGPIGDVLRPKFEEDGLVVLGFMELGFRHITNAVHPIETPADLEGLSIRLQTNPVHIATFEEYGANPVALDGTEIFPALRQGVVDGQENPYSVINNLRLYDANQPYVSETGHFFDLIVFAGSKRVLDSMTPEDRAAVIEAGRLATEEQRRLATADEAANREAVLETGMEMNQLTGEQRAAFIEASTPIYDWIRESIDPDFVGQFLQELADAQD